jgi:DNA-binding beta-propeller fold protein YncE
MKKMATLIVGGGLWLAALIVWSPMAMAEVKTETILSGLNNPCGVAIQPETKHVFVSDSGAGKIIRIVDGKAEDVIVGSPKDIYGKGPMYDIGPLGLLFLDKNTLVVGDGGYKDGEEYVRVYTVPEAGKPALDFDKDTKEKIGPLTMEGDLKPEGNFYALAATPTAIYITSNGDDTKGWVAKIERNGTKFGKLTRGIATKEATEVDAPVGITINAEGQIVVGQMGEINKPKDGLLTFYSAKTGTKLLNLETGLFDITGLAYAPKTGLLYATDFAWMETGEGGLFRLDQENKGGKQSVKATKIAKLDKPTALAFADDGSVYVTIIGTAKEGETAKVGALLKLSGL